MSNKAKILVVDDSIAIVNSLRSILGISGYDVDTAYSGSDALRKIHMKEYDLVICDIEMPGLSGLEFLGKVREDFERDLDVILMTGYLEHDYFIEAIRLGASDFIRKPIDTKQIVSSIRELIFRKRNRDDKTEFFGHLNKANFCFEMPAKNFSKVALSKIFSSYMRQYFKVGSKVLNELLICVDEMVYNAFIHGTLNLSLDERALSHEALQELIELRLQDPNINQRKVKFAFVVDNLQQNIEISVEDEGDGFEYQNWLKSVKKGQFLEIDGHGRGIAMLYHLSDKLSFGKQGKSVRIVKSLVSSESSNA
ncbi:MAG: response regulator [Candidatus Cloacimonetes bacterium]|jgi:DNA-binding response OmpR family regulator|nr:response regulator [Candidatus Cloacimonadota bacterium]MDY0299122.1 response regulator [Candidatus Cloacimonadaceae bacterium]MCB5278162.1 response regulator [Candidatus Cloacimonadota bacterium]MCK9333173.1 response regulator [Candidatus Cloacimonadota bacterium]MDD2210455.1 response regulator [Candidatus Cloacimonadota bacterium]